MRTTIDLPDPMFRQLKAHAALEGRKLEDLLADYVEAGLARSNPVRMGTERRDPPVLIPATGQRVPLLTSADVEEVLGREEAEKCRTFSM